MSISSKFKEYIWLVNTIHKAGQITLSEIQEKWLTTDMSEGIELSRTTFSRHKDAIEDIFGIYIECDRKNGYKYYIGNDRVLQENSIQNWMLSTLSVNNIISESLSLQDRIIIQPIPAENGYLPLCIQAMKQNLKIAIDYQRYGTNILKHFLIDPYCLKLFKQRWYVLGHIHYDTKPDKPATDYFATFSFDRIFKIKVTNIKFKIDHNFNAQSYFDKYFGVFVDNNSTVEKIVIRVYGYDRYYVKDLPIHTSQHQIKEGDNYTDFELFMCPTTELSKHLMSYGNNLKIIKPQWLAEEIHKLHADAAKLYEENNK